jgi:phospholipid/cholesterol/gamma-HCH transport system permease protein
MFCNRRRFATGDENGEDQPRLKPEHPMFQNVGEMVILLWRTLLALPRSWRQRDKIFDQFFEIGNASLLMVCILSFFIGGVIALQTGPVLVERGLATAVAGVVGISICKELAPVMMSILIAGRLVRPWRPKSAQCGSTRKSTPFAQ